MSKQHLMMGFGAAYRGYRGIAAAALIVAGSAWSQTPATGSDQGNTDVTSAKIGTWEDGEVGVSVGGRAMSQYLRAALSGDSANLKQPTHENLAYSQADVDFVARPSANTRGKLIFRIHQDWENYYEEGPNPLLTRWFDYEGKVIHSKVEFALGDFREKYSPLTLYAPEIGFLYEPEIFAGRRQQAMDEWFLGDNRLPLQGVHAVYRDSLSQSIGIQAGVTGARLRTGSSVASWSFWTDDVEKYLGAGFLDFKLFQGLDVGVTHLSIIDPVPTSRAENNQYVKLQPTSIYENVNVNAVNLGLDGKRFLSATPFTVRLDGELAMSGYQRAHDVSDSIGTEMHIVRNTTTGNPDTSYLTLYGLSLLKDKKIDGQAMRATLHAGYGNTEAPRMFGLSLEATYLNNDADYVNDVAQSPSFIGTRILNSKNGIAGFAKGYNSFDAVYNHVYTVDPVTNVNTSEFWFQDTKAYAGTNNWYRAASFKNSYTNATTTKSERDALVARMDPNLQLLYPFGPATPNRQGLDASVTATLLGKKLEAAGLFASLKEVKGQQVDSANVAAPATFARIGGGLQANVGELAGLKHRITVAASYVQDSRKQSGYTALDTAYGSTDFSSAMINAGVYANVWKGLSLLAGYQQIQSNPLIGYTTSAKTKTPDAGDLTQGNWAVGLEVKITHGAYIVAEYGMMDFQENKTKTKFSQDITNLNLVLGF